jgi:hypothetical protein
VALRLRNPARLTIAAFGHGCDYLAGKDRLTKFRAAACPRDPHGIHAMSGAA